MSITHVPTTLGFFIVAAFDANLHFLVEYLTALDSRCWFFTYPTAINVHSNTVDVTETCRFWNHRMALVLLNRSLENVIRTLTRYMYNALSMVRQHALRSTKTDVPFQLLPYVPQVRALCI